MITFEVPVNKAALFSGRFFEINEIRFSKPSFVLAEKSNIFLKEYSFDIFIFISSLLFLSFYGSVAFNYIDLLKALIFIWKYKKK